MTVLRSAIFCCFAVAAPFTHAKVVTTLRVSMETFAIRATDDHTPTRAIFTGTPVRGEIALVAAALPGDETVAPIPRRTSGGGT